MEKPCVTLDEVDLLKWHKRGANFGALIVDRKHVCKCVAKILFWFLFRSIKHGFLHEGLWGK